MGENGGAGASDLYIESPELGFTGNKNMINSEGHLQILSDHR